MPFWAPTRPLSLVFALAALAMGSAGIPNPSTMPEKPRARLDVQLTCVKMYTNRYMD